MPCGRRSTLRGHTRIVDAVVEALAEEHAGLHGPLQKLTEDQWTAPTRCAGWDVSDVVTHLAQTDEMAIGSATGRYEEVLSGLTQGLSGASSIDDGVAAMVEREKGAAPEELLDRWWTNATGLVGVLDSMNLSTRVMWVTGELSARSMATTRLSETWIHAGDIASAVGADPPYSDRLFHIARLAWRTLPYAFGSVGKTMSGPIAFHLVSPSGENWDFEPDDPPTTTLTGAASELCDVASRRRLASDTALPRTARTPTPCSRSCAPTPEHTQGELFASAPGAPRLLFGCHGLTSWEGPEGSGLCRREIVLFDAPYAPNSPEPQKEPTVNQTPKIELHVHLEGTVRPKDLLEIASRNRVTLPAQDEESLGQLYRFRDFDHFVELWVMTTAAIRTERDFRQIVTSYAEEAASFGAVYLEGIFTPAERISGGASWDEVFTGFCDGAAEAKESSGVEVRLTPDIPRGFPLEAAMETARYAAKYRDRGVVGLGLGGLEAQFPPAPYAEAFRFAKDAGLGSVPHAGEVAGAESIRSALRDLAADRIRHGIRCVEDPSLVRELADRGIVCDVCPVSNLRTAAVVELSEHPLRRMLEAGVSCSISTDDPAMFGTDLENDYGIAADLGCSAEMAFRAGIQGALCDDATRVKLAKVMDSFEWDE